MDVSVFPAAAHQRGRIHRPVRTPSSGDSTEKAVAFAQVVTARMVDWVCARWNVTC
jgi:hypothetical protein